MTTTTVINFKRSAFGVKTKHRRLVIIIFFFLRVFTQFYTDGNQTVRKNKRVFRVNKLYLG